MALAGRRCRGGAVVKFELLTDQDDAPAGATVRFADCEQLGAANLRGTGWARTGLRSRGATRQDRGTDHRVEVNVTGIAGFLLAKLFAAHARRAPKDWYDIAVVLLHNEEGGPVAAGARVGALGGRPTGAAHSALLDLGGNFATPATQGPVAYAGQMVLNHPELEPGPLRADAVLAVEAFIEAVRAE